MQIAIIEPDGTLRYDELPENDHEQLSTIQGHVGGDIQIVPVNFVGCSVFVNEYGIDLDLERNYPAELALDWPSTLLGPVVVTGGLHDEKDVGLSAAQREAIKHALGVPH